jgi:DHA1 family bicyclomycin/chloramphenicol resistance-like MFS transporter
MNPREFVAFVTMSLVVGALATDLMVPALAGISDDLALGGTNLGQTAIFAFLLGMGMSQLLFGPMGDRYGRRPLLLVGAGVFVAGAALAALAGDVTTLVGARLVQGVGAGAMRVAVYSTVRDRLSGSGMARTLSLAMAGLLLEPIVAPMLGQLVLLLGSWRWIPMVMAATSAAVLFWAWWRLDESLPLELRRPIVPASVVVAYRIVLADRHALAHMFAYALAMGAYVGFLTSAQGVFQQTYETGLRFTPLLAFVSLATAIGAFINVRLIRYCDSAHLILRALWGQIVVNGLALAAASADLVGLRVFLAIQCSNMFAFGVLAPNLTTMTMSRLGHVAGTASSLFGFVTTSLGALLGFAVGQFFDGTVRPLLAGYFVLSATALLILTRAGADVRCGGSRSAHGTVAPGEDNVLASRGPARGS